MPDFASLIARQRTFFASHQTRSLNFRTAQLEKLHAAIIKLDAELMTALHADLRRSPIESQLTEIGLVLSEIHYAIRHLAKWMRPQRRTIPWMALPGKARVAPEPLGVALIIGPWNYPVQLLLLPLIGAIAAGNCAILKPSELAPHTAAVLAKLIAETFPSEYIAAIEGDQQTSESLLSEKFDHIFFTGSSNVGRIVMTAAAKHLTPVTLELGGKCPAIVCEDAPIEITARRIAWGKFMNAGQTCVAPDFVLVHRSIHQPLVDALKRAIRQFYGENPQQSPDFGRIINRRHFDRLIGYTGQTTNDPADLFIAPTILPDISPDAPLMQEEIFGPILPVIAFDQLDQAFAQLRNRPTPLALYLFTKNRQTQQHIIDHTRSGGVCINDAILHMIGKDLPFGGLGESGMGNYHGKASFDCFSHPRTILNRSLAIDPSLRYPPPRVSLATMKRAIGFLLRS